MAICLPGLQRALRARDVDVETCVPGAMSDGDVRERVARADVVHVFGWGSPFTRAFAAAARKTDTPYVISPLGGLSNAEYDGAGWRDRLRRSLIDSRLVRNASTVTALNDAEEHELGAGRVHASVSSLPVGIDVADYAVGEADRGECPRVLLVMAPVHPAEGYIPFLKALSELGEEAQAWGVVIAGAKIEDWQQQLEAAVRRKGGADRVKFVEASNETSQRDWLRQASILVAPSLHPRCGVSVMQAVAAGVPVLATSCAAPTTREDVVRICAPTRGDMKLGLRALIKLGDEGRAAFAKKAREHARSLFDWSALCDQYVQLYSNIAKRVAR